MVIHPVVQSLIDEIEAFRARTGMSATAFGTQSLNDGGFIADLVSGERHPSLKTMDRVRNFIASQSEEA